MQQYAEVNRLFWNGSLFQYIFYGCIVLILCFERRRTHKLVFCAFPLAMLAGMFNPVTASAIGLFFHGADVYYVRLFSIIPVFYCMAHGATLLLKKLRGAAKAVGMCAVVVLIAIAGNCVYREPWMQRAENLQKTPDEVFAVLDAIPHQGRTTKVALPEPLFIYARQVDGNILMPYGRELRPEVNPFMDEISKPVPDASAVMRLAGNDDVDYVVIHRSEEAVASFREQGYEPISETPGYCIYSVTKTPRIEMTLNDKRQVVASTSLDSEGNPAYNNISVITTNEYEYDRWGNQTSETYFDKDGRRVTRVGGYSRRKMSYTLHGLAWLPDSISYLDNEDRQLLVSGRYETRYQYLRRRDLIKESYYDADGKPMNRLDVGYAAAIKEYNDSGRILSERYLDVSGNAKPSVDGYAGLNREYDDNNHIVSEKYCDIEGNPVNNEDGFAQWVRSYDESGNVIDETFFDQDGHPAAIRECLLKNTSEDLLLKLRKESVGNSVGVGYSWNADGSCSVAGEAQGISWNDLIMAEKPFFFLNGQTYRVEYAADNVVLRIAFYEDASWSNELVAPAVITGDSEFTVPQNCGAMIIRLWVAPGTSVNETVHPRIYVKADGE